MDGLGEVVSSSGCLCMVAMVSVAGSFGVEMGCLCVMVAMTVTDWSVVVLGMCKEVEVVVGVSSCVAVDVMNSSVVSVSGTSASSSV